MGELNNKSAENRETASQKISSDDIRNRIYTIRGVQVKLDSDLAELYQVETKALNQAVKRNVGRFPEKFRFRLSESERDELVTNCDRLDRLKHSTVNPFVFTESGVAMLSSILHSNVAVQISVEIMDAFVAMRHFISENAIVLQRLRDIDLKLLEHDKNFKEIFRHLQNPKDAKAVLFFKGQMWDATSLIEDIICKSKNSIILIDGYVDKKNLDLFSKKRKNVTIELYTSKNGNKLTQKEITDFNNQYGGLTVKYTDEFHDRFMILDKTELYHIGASLKDAGAKAFELSIIDDYRQLKEILKRLG